MNRVLQTLVVFLSILASIVSEHGTHNAVRTPCDHNNGGCSSTCLTSSNEQGYSCACPTGIPLLSDKKTCAHQGHAFLLVANNKNILKISLDDSTYRVEELQLDGINFVVDVDFDPLEGKMYWIEFNSRVIRRAYLNGSGQQDIVSSDLLLPCGIAIDSIARQLYWTDWWNNRIETSNLNGTNRKVIMRDETVQPDAIVVDTRSKRIYWTDSTDQRIERSSLDGTSRSVVIGRDEGWPMSLALDDERRIIYWGYYYIKKIEMANVDGSERRVLLSNNNSNIYGLCLLGDYIYWTDRRKKVIERADKKTGDNLQVVVDNLYDPWRIKSIIFRYITEQTCDSLVNPQHGYIRQLTNNNSVHSVATFACHPGYRLVGEENATCLWIDNKLQWSNPTPECVKEEKCKGLSFDSYNITYDPEREEDFWTEMEYRNGTRATVTCEDGFEIFPFRPINTNAATTVCVDGQWKPDIANCTPVRTPCDHKNGGCSSTCLVSTNEQGYSCSCPKGIPLLSDKRTCAHEGQSFLLVANGESILKISLDDSNYTALELLLEGLKWVSDIDYDPIQGYIYWLDEESRVIRRAYLDGYEQQDIVSTDLSSPAGIAIDDIAGKLYWTDSDKHSIEMSDLNGNNHKVIMRDETAQPSAILVDSGAKRIYWTNFFGSRIESLSLDGTNRSVVISTNEGWPISLALDDEHKIIYWGSPRTKKIEMANVDGSDRRVLKSNGIRSIDGLSLIGDYIYWSDKRKKQIGRVHKITGEKRKVIAKGLYQHLSNLKSIIIQNITDKSVKDCHLDLNGKYDLTAVHRNHTYEGQEADFVHRSTVKFSCKTFYSTFEGAKNITCIDGQWSKEIPKCKQSSLSNLLRPPILVIYFGYYGKRINADDGRVIIPKKTLFSIGCMAGEKRQLILNEQNISGKQLLKVKVSSEDMLSSDKVINPVTEKTEATVECINSKGISTELNFVIADTCEVDENELNRRGLQVVPDSRQRIYVEGDRIKVECSSNKRRTVRFIMICISGREWEYANNMDC